MIERESRYKKTTGKHGKAFVKDDSKPDDVTEELKTEEKPEDKKPAKKTKRKGIVKVELLNVRTTPEKPTLNNNIICTISKGSSVIINEDAPNNWFSITAEPTTGIKVTGYVMSRFIKEVK